MDRRISAGNPLDTAIEALLCTDAGIMKLIELHGLLRGVLL